MNVIAIEEKAYELMKEHFGKFVYRGNLQQNYATILAGINSYQSEIFDAQLPLYSFGDTPANRLKYFPKNDCEGKFNSSLIC